MGVFPTSQLVAVNDPRAVAIQRVAERKKQLPSVRKGARFIMLKDKAGRK